MPQLTLQQALQIALEHHRAGRQADAESICRQILAVQPAHAESLNLLSIIAYQAGYLEQATELCRRAIAAAPNNAGLHFDLGAYLEKQNKIDQAILEYRRALELKSDHVEARYNLGVALWSKGDFDEAIACYQAVLSVRPDLAEAHNNLGNAWKEIGKLDAAIAAYRSALRCKPDFAGAHSNLIYALHFHPDYDSRMIYTEQVRWRMQHADPLKKFIQPNLNDRNPDRRLRIGYVSPDFRNHPIGRFIAPLLACRDRRAFEAVCYCQATASDELTAKLQSHADLWRSISEQSDEAVAEMVRQDRIDILVDLTMHMANNRLLVFARKPAPVQVSYLPYPEGTGLDTIDYRLTDRYLDTAEIDAADYAERAVCLSGSYWCYQQSVATPPVNELPARSAGVITFGCMNNFCKLSRGALETWCEILRSIPGSRLLLHSATGNHRKEFLGDLQDLGITPDRVEMIGHVSPEEYFQNYHRIDIALDPFPYPGGTTTCDALWMGVPVITLAGRSLVQREGVSILSNAGLGEMIAPTRADYIRLAIDLASDPIRLTGLRSTLRERLLNSPLMDAASYARSIEEAFRAMWRSWCNSFVQKV